MEMGVYGIRKQPQDGDWSPTHYGGSVDIGKIE